MSIICSEIEELHPPNVIESKCVYATIDPKTFNKSPLPSDYNYGKFCLPKKYAQIADRIHNFKVRSDDIWIVGYQKSGTTWMQNITGQLKNDLDFSAPVITYSQQLLEHAMWRVTNLNDEIDDLDKEFDRFDELLSPRQFKSHLPAYLLPKQLWTVRPKIIYTARNPKDIAISTYHYMKNLKVFSGTKEHLFDLFLSETISLGPLHDHVLSFWQLRHLDHVLFSNYEELLFDQFNGMKRISKFLKCSYSDQQLRKLSEYLSFDNMKEKIPIVTVDGIWKDDSEHRFCRKGKAGSYRDEMSDEYIKRFDEWTADRLKNSHFQYASV